VTRCKLRSSAFEPSDRTAVNQHGLSSSAQAGGFRCGQRTYMHPTDPNRIPFPPACLDRRAWGGARLLSSPRGMCRAKSSSWRDIAWFRRAPAPSPPSDRRRWRDPSAQRARQTAHANREMNPSLLLADHVANDIANRSGAVFTRVEFEVFIPQEHLRPHQIAPHLVPMIEMLRRVYAPPSWRCTQRASPDGGA